MRKMDEGIKCIDLKQEKKIIMFKKDKKTDKIMLQQQRRRMGINLLF